MSKKLFFGSNLKMYKNIKDTVSYLQELESLTKDISRDEIELFIIPSYTTLDSASKAIDQKNIRLGAQNMCWEEKIIIPLPLPKRNSDDRRQWRKQGGVVGAAASKMRAPLKA